MFTFILSLIVSGLISGIIFKKRIKENIPIVIVITISITLISMSIVTGVLSKDIPYSNVVTREKAMELRSSEIIMLDDTISFDSYLEFRYIIREDSSLKYNRLDVGGDTEPFSTSRQNQINLHFMSENDTIPYYKVVKRKRTTDSRWISQMAMPNEGKRVFEVYLPDDSIHNVLINHINEKFYETVQLN